MATITREGAPSRPAGGATDTVLERGEGRFRLVAAWALWYCLFQAALGLAWDIRWHGAVGRDTFWSPPHLLLYSGITVAGIICLAVVLADTWRYHRGAPGVDDGTTWPVLGLFHAPLGFVVAGCGLATLLAAAPLDNWWHELYGLDVTIWAPFHVMGLIGAGVAGIGLVYAFGALATCARREGRRRKTFLGLGGLDWATLLALSGLLSLLLTAAQPATTIAPTLDLGRLRLLTLPVLLCAFLPPLFIAAVRLTGRPGAATAVIGLYLVRQVILAAFVPWAIRVTVATYGYEYRTAPPTFNLFLALSPLFFLPAALAIDGLAWWRHRTDGSPRPLQGRDLPLASVLSALSLLVVAPGLVRGTAAVASRGQLPPELTIPAVSIAPALLLAAPVALAAALLSVRLGAGWGAILRLNDR